MDRVLNDFLLACGCGYMSKFCKCWNIYQMNIQKGPVTKVSFGQLALIDTPFKRV